MKRITFILFISLLIFLNRHHFSVEGIDAGRPLLKIHFGELSPQKRELYTRIQATESLLSEQRRHEAKNLLAELERQKLPPELLPNLQQLRYRLLEK